MNPLPNGSRFSIELPVFAREDDCKPWHHITTCPHLDFDSRMNAASGLNLEFYSVPFMKNLKFSSLLARQRRFTQVVKWKHLCRATCRLATAVTTCMTDKVLVDVHVVWKF